MKTKTTTLVCSILLLATAFVSCQDIADDDHYAPPSWLKGNAWEVLEKQGNYTNFLKAIELTGNKPIVNGQNLMTVMAADDNAWKSFLQQKGYANVEDMYAQAPDELKKTVAYHLMYYSYDWSKMINFRPNEGDRATEEERENAQNAGFFFNHRTHSADPMESFTGKLNGRDTTITLYHYERLLPTLSYKMFSTKQIDAKSNYEYFYPNSQWAGAGKFNVANAAVTDNDAVVTDNGYLYHVDQVIKPLETIHKTLSDNPNYSNFLKLYDSYAELQEVAAETSENIGKIVYRLTHGNLPNIACEWPVTDYRLMSTMESNVYNIFAPSNKAINHFFTSYWTKQGGYESLDDLDPLISYYFIAQSFANTNLPVFPEEIRKGLVETSYGTPVNINPDDVDDRLFCENGIVYGMDDMKAPAIFSSVVGPAFRDTTYKCFLYTLDKSDLLLSLASNKTKFVTLIPSNKQYRQSDPIMRLNKTINGNVLEVFGEDGFAEMSVNQARDIVNTHVAQNISELKTTGVQVIQNNANFSYWYIKDGKITTNSAFNNLLIPEYTGDPFVAFHETLNDGQQWDNGRAYTYDNSEIFKSASSSELSHVFEVANDKNYEYYLFAQLLQKAGLTADSEVLFPTDFRTIVFVPTNAAIKANLSSIPGTDRLSINDNGTLTGTPTASQKTSLANYLRQYFVSSLTNTIADYPYPGSDFKGKYLTMAGNYLFVSSTDSSININLEGSSFTQSVSSRFYRLPFVYSDGCMQFIDGILK